MLCERLSGILMSKHSVDQAAYRKGFSVQDHIFVITQVIEKSREFNLPLWCVLIDYQKAFDSVEHPMLWRALSDLGVPSGYIALLQSLYSDQCAYVQTTVPSRLFSFKRGVLQGDP